MQAKNKKKSKKNQVFSLLFYFELKTYFGYFYLLNDTSNMKYKHLNDVINHIIYIRYKFLSDRKYQS